LWQTANYLREKVILAQLAFLRMLGYIAANQGRRNAVPLDSFVML
jgi:hypothetical protein